MRAHLRFLPAWLAEDPEFGPAVFVLDDPLLRDRAWPHINVLEREIDFDAIREQCFATSELLLIWKDLSSEGGKTWPSVDAG